LRRDAGHDTISSVLEVKGVAVGELSIGEVARRAGLRPSALRYYESIGLLAQPQRVNSRRRYDESAVVRLAAILAAQRAGFTLAEIQTLFNGFATEVPFSKRWQLLADHKHAELEAAIARAQEMQRHLVAGLACTCVSAETCGLLVC
jgi:MerR family transcriptional regulator, redox-sensitive transcriptional activator SoxR